MAQPCAVALHALARGAIASDQTVALFGVGSIGNLLLAALQAQAAGGQRVIAIDVEQGRLATAKRLGAFSQIDARVDDPVAAIGELTGGRGVDVAIDATGVPETIAQALALGRDCEYGNGASIFTRSGWAARQFKRHASAGMIGINVGVPAPMAWFPFTGWNQSFFGDLHIQGVEGVHFYTRQKMTMTRWFATARESAHDPIWKK